MSSISDTIPAHLSVVSFKVQVGAPGYPDHITVDFVIGSTVSIVRKKWFGRITTELVATKRDVRTRIPRNEVEDMITDWEMSWVVFDNWRHAMIEKAEEE